MNAFFLMIAASLVLVHTSSPMESTDSKSRFRGARFICWTDFSEFTQSECGENPILVTSPEVDPDITWDELVISWNARLVKDAHLRIEARVIYPDRETRWYVLGLWSGDPTQNPRESVRKQKDADGDVQTDTLVMREPGGKVQVRVAMADAAKLTFLGLSFVDTKAKPDPLKPNKAAWGKVIDVPELSQLAYEGGRGWCSPASTCMALNYWGKKLGRSNLAVKVPEVAAGVDDPKWPGTGNWPFNTAYAGSFPGIRAYVTRLSDLSEVEDWIAAGAPVVMSVLPRLLTGSDSASNGHLIVAVGFTTEGDLIANDPWARLERGQSVRRTYKRANAAAAWAASHNTVYLIYPQDWKVPKDRFGHWAGK